MCPWLVNQHFALKDPHRKIDFSLKKRKDWSLLDTNIKIPNFHFPPPCYYFCVSIFFLVLAFLAFYANDLTTVRVHLINLLLPRLLVVLGTWFMSLRLSNLLMMWESFDSNVSTKFIMKFNNLVFLLIRNSSMSNVCYFVKLGLSVLEFCVRTQYCIHLCISCLWFK